MDKVGVRELRQNASRILDRVKAGETVTVTDRGRSVARISPAPESEWEAMIESGAITPPRSTLPLHEVSPMVAAVSASAILAELREGDR